MRASVASLSKKLISTFFAATLAVGLVPVAAFAVEDDASIVEDAETIDIASADQPAESSSADDAAVDADASASTIPAADVINKTMPLEVVAQAESTRSYFLAQTLESTRTVPMVSAKLPVDTTASEEPVISDGNGTTMDEGEDSDESDLGGSSIAAESTVVGSFAYRGITYAVEPGGDSVAIVAADCTKLPADFIEAGIIVLPSQVSLDDIDYYSVARIAQGSFSSLFRASQDLGAPIHSAMRSFSDDAESGQTDEEQVAENDNVDGISAITIPASVVNIETDAFAGFDTLRYVIVSSDNPNYSMYDGCLYTADQTSLLLVPEGRTGAVRIAPNVTSLDPEVFSHCPSDVVLVADAGSAAFTVLENVDIRNASDELIEVVPESDDALVDAVYSEKLTAEVGDILNPSSTQDVSFAFSDDDIELSDGVLVAVDSGTSEVATITVLENVRSFDIVTVCVNAAMEENVVSGAESFDESDNDTTAVFSDESSDGSELAISSRAVANVAGYGNSRWGDGYTLFYSVSGKSLVDVDAAGFKEQPKVYAKDTHLGEGIVRIYHYNGKLITEYSAGGFYAKGLTEEGGITSIQYAYSLASTRYNVPSGSQGVAVSSTIYIWVYDSSSTGNSYWGTDYDLYNCGLHTHRTLEACVSTELPETTTHFTGGTRLGQNIVRLYHYDNRVVRQYAGGAFYSSGLKQGGGVAAIKYSYTRDGTQYYVPTGADGIAVTGKIYIWLYSSADAGNSYWGDSYDLYNSAETKSLEAAASYELPDTKTSFVKGSKLGTNIKRLYHYRGRIIREYNAGGFFSAGITRDGGITSVLYSDSLIGEKFNVPTGPSGIAVSGKIYIWITDGSSVAFFGTWNANGGTYPDGYSEHLIMYPSAPGAVSGPDSLPTRENYVFSGWATTADAATGVETVSPTKSTTYYAVWTPYYTITLSTADASNASSLATELYVKKGVAKLYSDTGCTKEVTSIATKPSRTSYLFDGYGPAATVDSTKYITAAGAVTGLTASTFTASTTLNIQWRPVSTITVYKRLDGGTTAESTKLYYKHGGTTLYTTAECTTGWTANDYKPTRLGYTFDGYCNNSSNTTQYLTAACALTDTFKKAYLATVAPSTAVTFYAKWNENSYTIGFDANGGTTSKANGGSQLYTANVKTPTAVEATRNGYELLGWSKIKRGTQTSLPSGDIAPNANVSTRSLYSAQGTIPATITLYAVWKVKNYTITLTSEKGTFVTGIAASYASASLNTSDTANDVLTITYTVESAAFSLPSATQMKKTGYGFSGWKRNNQGSAAASVNIPKGTFENRVYTASFVRDGDYKISFDLGKDPAGEWPEEFEAPVTYNVDMTIVPIKAVPARAGYHFDGWQGGNDASKACVSNDKQTVTITEGVTTGDLTFTALWSPVLYQITLQAGMTSNGDRATFDEGAKAAYESISGNVYKTDNAHVAVPTLSDDKTTLVIPYTYESSAITLPTTSGSGAQAVPKAAGGWRFDGWAQEDDVASLSITIDPHKAMNHTYEASWSPIVRVAVPVDSGMGSANEKTIYLDVITGDTGTALADKNGKATDIKIISYTPVDTFFTATSIAPSTSEGVPDDSYARAFFETIGSGAEDDIADIVDTMTFRVNLGIGDGDKAHSFEFARRNGTSESFVIEGKTSYGTDGLALSGTLDLLLDTSKINDTVRIRQMNDPALETKLGNIKDPLLKHLSRIVWTVSMADEKA